MPSRQHTGLAARHSISVGISLIIFLMHIFIREHDDDKSDICDLKQSAKCLFRRLLLINDLPKYITRHGRS